MSVRNRRERPLVLTVAALIVAVVPACQASAKDRKAWVAQRPVAPYVAYRPAYPEPLTRPPLYISGYAGANYGRGPRASYAPTGYLLEYGRPPGRRPFLGWWGR
jgi:hypothetical protein